MPIPSDALDARRQEWLASLRAAHAAAPGAASALALARGEWMCGEYDAALAHFTRARDHAPAEPGLHLALVRAASGLALEAEERDALAFGRALHPDDPALALHDALGHVPGDIGHARALLARHLGHPLVAQYAAALAAIAGEAPPPAGDDAASRARLAGLDWVLRHADSPAVHVGIPGQVLGRALDAAVVAGTTLECGVYFGRSLRTIAARTPGTVHGFDSFEGLPEAWKEGEGAGTYSTGGRLPQVAGNVELHRGWFEDTLPVFFARERGPVRLLHIDCDIHSATRTVLANAASRLVPGSMLVFDDMLGYPGFEKHELRAFEEFVSAHGVRWQLVAACLLGREVAVRILG